MILGLLFSLCTQYVPIGEEWSPEMDNSTAAVNFDLDLNNQLIQMAQLA